MTPVDFLRAVWPTEGIYCLATTFKIPGTSVVTYAHKTFETIDGAANYVDRNKSKIDLFFTVHSLKQAEVWNPAKPNRKTGELGAYEVRTQANTLAAKCFFFDLDVGDKAGKYATQVEALKDLIRFCKETKLPKPLVTSSGGGLHVYWLLSDAIASDVWKGHASKLRALAKHHGLRADPMRTTDSASVLRVAGTFNHKDAAHPRPVLVLVEGGASPTGEFLKAVSDALVRAGVQVKDTPALPRDDLGLGSNLTNTFEGPPVAFKALVAACPQMQRQVRLKGDVTEPEWYFTLNIVRFVENGKQLAHKMSAGHPDYTPEATDAKMAQLEAKGIGPTSCFKMAEVAGDELCEGCPFAGRVKGPLNAARFKDDAPQPVVQQMVGTTTVSTAVPPPPEPYTRQKDGNISKHVRNKDGDMIHSVFLHHDLYPIRRIVNEASETEQQVWRVTLPRHGDRDFVLDADALYDKRKFIAAISNQGIYPNPGDIDTLQAYMVAYIAKLQQLADAEAQCNHLGWTDEQTKFIMPDKILLRDGKMKPATLSLGAARSSAQVHKKGTLQRQVELMQFYNHPAYAAAQFFILAGLAAPIFFATGHHGIIINATGDAGASKSTSLYTAASFWGQPELYPINGTNNGATVRGRNERVTTLANLPVCVDEITHMPAKEAVDLAMSITQPGHRIRLNTEGVERVSSGSYKATMMLSTANSSLHGLLSVDNAAGTAGSMRVFEIVFKKLAVHQKFEADAYLHDLKENFGHIGEEFIFYVIQNLDAVAARVREVVKEIDVAANIQSSERFYSAAIAAVLVSCEISFKLGLLPFDVALIRDWVLTKQLPYMRGIVAEAYVNPMGVLADYLEHISGDMLISRAPHAMNNLPNIVHQPRGQLLGHYAVDDGVMWLSKKGFKDYCTRTGANSLKILHDLSEPVPQKVGPPLRIVSHTHIRKVLGAGSEFAKAQSWCFAVNMRHPEVTGTLDIDTENKNNVTPIRRIV